MRCPARAPQKSWLQQAREPQLKRRLCGHGQARVPEAKRVQRRHVTVLQPGALRAQQNPAQVRRQAEARGSQQVDTDPWLRESTAAVNTRYLLNRVTAVGKARK